LTERGYGDIIRAYDSKRGAKGAERELGMNENKAVGENREFVENVIVRIVHDRRRYMKSEECREMYDMVLGNIEFLHGCKEFVIEGHEKKEGGEKEGMSDEMRRLAVRKGILDGEFAVKLMFIKQDNRFMEMDGGDMVLAIQELCCMFELSGILAKQLERMG